MLGFGLFKPKRAYFKRKWCIFDFLIIGSAYFEICVRSLIGKRIGCTFLYLRVIRAVVQLCNFEHGSSHWPRLVAQLQALGDCMSRMTCIIVVVVSFLVTFAIIATNVLGASGTFCMTMNDNGTLPGENKLILPYRRCRIWGSDHYRSVYEGHQCKMIWSDSERHFAFQDKLNYTPKQALAF